MKHSPTVVRLFILDEIGHFNRTQSMLRRIVRNAWNKARGFMSLFDTIRLCRYIATIDQRTAVVAQKKRERTIECLKVKRFGSQIKDSSQHVFNRSDYKLSNMEAFALVHGFDFGIPNNNIKREEIFAEFELFYAQLSRHQPGTNEADEALRARLSDLAHAYCGLPNDVTAFQMQRECIAAIRALRRNDDIHICKPDKGTGVVILNKIDYINKMMDILTDETKFQRWGSAAEHDRTSCLEDQIIKRLLQLHKCGQLSKEQYNRIKPVGAQHPRMYGLAKINKENVPLRPILSMIGSA